MAVASVGRGHLPGGRTEPPQPNTYEAPGCQETNHPYERFFCFFPLFFWRRRHLAMCPDVMSVGWWSRHGAAPHTD
jgi:hypothetical protein